MVGASLWTVLLVVGAAITVVKEFIGIEIVKAIGVRLAALCYGAAGTIGASGWMGDWSRQTITWGVTTGQHLSKAAVGSAILIGALIAIVTLVWIATLFPNHWFGMTMRDGFAIAGLFLPSLAATIPGPIGGWLRDDVWPALAQPMIDGVSKVFGG